MSIASRVIIVASWVIIPTQMSMGCSEALPYQNPMLIWKRTSVMSMSDEAKPGFLDGILRGLQGKDREADSPQVTQVKELCASLELTNKERGDLAGWLMGEVVSTIVRDMIADVPPE